MNLFFLRIWLSNKSKKSCYLFSILTDVGFTLSIIVLKHERKKEVIGNFKSCWRLCERFPRKPHHVGLCMEMYWSLYPLQFCGHRCCENEKSAVRAELIMEGYRKFITHTFSLKKSNPMVKIKAFNIWKVRSMTLCCLPNCRSFLKWFSVRGVFKMLPNQQTHGQLPTPLEIWFMISLEELF